MFKSCNLSHFQVEGGLNPTDYNKISKETGPFAQSHVTASQAGTSSPAPQSPDGHSLSGRGFAPRVSLLLRSDRLSSSAHPLQVMLFPKGSLVVLCFEFFRNFCQIKLKFQDLSLIFNSPVLIT